MVEHACIAIGIDRYEHLQPLRYAQADAGAFQRCVATIAAVPDSQSWLLAETSPKRSGRSTYPSLENIDRSIAQICALPLQPEDILWCFFCGYGVNFLGKDYLMPIEGNPQDIQETGISVESFLARLKQAKTKNLRVFLDISRPTGKYAGVGIGSETLELADKLEIAVMLSCQPEQFSHETSALDGGLFTAALVEALDSQKCPTLESLDRYMRDRLPQLCDHHWRPKQDPVTIVGRDEQLHQSLFPAKKGTAPGKDHLETQPKLTSTQEPLPQPKPTAPANPTWERWLWFGGLAATILLLGVLLAHEISLKDRSPSEESSDTSQFP
ncbi:caspase family protein [Oscillatoriales cyanobacterium LEGE 11467]|uniref:Caspase family protein n=1 Tax=Zarconia navalis LEGE 11467 TaxID=1828826 RepID=A0A928W3Q0_9CYAN|nr:caspase family protein [Zarconia navalis]MBE9042630.1 caspase family protein [Zarconia navalis LEGE 11467]